MEAAPNLKPDVIVVDIGMPLMNGLEAGQRLKEQMPAVKFIFLTMNEDPDVAVASNAFRGIRVPVEEFRRFRIDQRDPHIVKGKVLCYAADSPRNAEVLYQNPQPKERAKNLTPRQREVVQLLQRVNQ